MPAWAVSKRSSTGPRVNVTDDYTVTGPSLIAADASGPGVSPLIVSLPAAANFTGSVTIVNVGATGTVTIDPSGSEPIAGSLTKNLTSQWSAATIQSVGTGWIIEDSGTGGGGGGGASILDDLTDVTISSPVLDNSLVYNGTQWVNQTLATTYTDEQARDAIGTALVAGTNIAVTVNDPADTITIATTGLATIATSGSATNLTAGTVPVGRLGSSGTPDATTFLRGDNTWAVPPGGGGGLTEAQVRTRAMLRC